VITGGLVLVLLVVGEIARAADRDGPAARILSLLLVPAAIGFGALLALRVLDLVVGRA
jgi:hypothetical protein